MFIDKFSIDPDWCVIEDDFDISRARHYESVMALGTGYMTIRSSIDEGFSGDEQNIAYERKATNVSLEATPTTKSRWGTFIPLVQGRHPHWNVGVMNLPYMLGLEVHADGHKLDMETGKISGYRRWLDLKTATLYRALVWELPKGKKLDLLFKRYMDPDDRFVCLQELDIATINCEADVVVKSYIDNDVRTNGYEKFRKHSVGFTADRTLYSDITGNLGDRVATVSRMICNKPTTYEASQGGRRITECLAFALGKNKGAHILKVSAQAASVYFDRGALLDEGVKMIEAVMKKGPASHHAAHIAKWAEKWEASDVKIAASGPEGQGSQLAIRQAVYHLLRARSTDPRALNCAKGSTSEMYLGSVCWDMEIFFQPFYIYTQPALAKMTGLYRYNTLDGARRSAKSMNYIGARYPWQTDRNGDEVCPLFEYADHEIHITADVVVGLWHYYQNTLDKDFLYNQGLEIILETARYWSARATKVKGRQGWHIFGVMGPDEYKPFTNNNAYTNFVARENLRLAGIVVGMCKTDAPKVFKKICERIGFDEKELELFGEIADGLPIPKDKKRNIVWQCERFDTDFCEIDIEGLWEDKSRLFGAYTTQELRYRAKCLKQSDVIALMGLYTEAFSKKEMAASYDYYNRFTIHDSSNSICHNAIVATRIGRPGTAWESWNKSIDIDFGPSPRASEGVHFANVGGMWQEIVFGFGGMKSALAAETLTFDPCMPEELESISFQITWKGQRAEVTVEKERVSVKNQSGTALSFAVCGSQATAPPNATASVDY